MPQQVPVADEALVRNSHPRAFFAAGRRSLAKFQSIADDLKNRPDADEDNLEGLVTIGRLLVYMSVDDLRTMWSAVKSQDELIVDMFIDSVATVGSNPAIMFLKEVIESEQISGARAVWAVSAIGTHAKTPTRELLHELVVSHLFILIQIQTII